MRESSPFDLLIVGGGINGAGIARDAAGRGLRVLLCERDDLAAHTSSASTKLIHGGLRYLELGEFRLVRKALQEREVLLEAAPHIIRPLSFVMPQDPQLRPGWMIRAGLFLYDHLARRRWLPGSGSLDLRRHPAGAPLVPQTRRGFVYSDAWVEDARLVVLNAVDAAERGASVLTRTRLERATREGDHWRATLSPASAPAFEVRARAVVNAAGPWVGEILDRVLHRDATRQLRLVKGSHIVVRRLFEHEFAYLLQNPDGRILFAIPFEHDFTLLGTTDIEYRGDPARVTIDADEIRYLCDMAGRWFGRPVDPTEIVWSYAGVRPLLDDEAGNPASVTRDYRLELDDEQPPLLTVFGGKLTTYRRLAEDALAQLAPQLGHSARGWTRGVPLPGGDLPDADFARFEQSVALRWPWLPAPLRQRYAHAYGTRMTQLLQPIASMADLGEQVLPGLYAVEIHWLVDQEFAHDAADILWRRSRLGLHLPADAAPRLDAWLAAHARDR
ncbi:MAG: glycerol-3-phosphate dehydrogenase [Sinobacteraceae bacterium]|nr:glycerol-3-phosphate dehydrogenase [Nevskiaceae bacterium]MCP5338958.1 glycerol-3-phosphate dehydrogenase [Nevskiaceae bacterium]MCP5359629.1 glycerol-3-phosphate dehydrogenase [Nevskiaceae bacterium]MCP5472577.1 glycerol-3-phosphate dehydrogenase [Nevskiaceae bacterium]